MSSILADVIVVSGVAAVIGGCWLLHPSAGMIVGGGFAIWFSSRITRAQSSNSERDSQE